MIMDLSSIIDDALSGRVTNLRYAFAYHDTFEGENARFWQVAGVTDMRGAFAGAVSFNADISRWDVSNVEDMTSMFDGAASFCADLSRWDVSNVEEFEHMFDGATAFLSKDNSATRATTFAWWSKKNRPMGEYMIQRYG